MDVDLAMGHIIQNMTHKEESAFVRCAGRLQRHKWHWLRALGLDPVKSTDGEDTRKQKKNAEYMYMYIHIHIYTYIYIYNTFDLANAAVYF